jgi:hypothetical protein
MRSRNALIIKNGKIFAELVLGTENDKYDNHEIIKMQIRRT